MKPTTPKIMILSASFGDGHTLASQAVEVCFRSKGIQDIIVLDLLAEAHPFLNDLTKFVYLNSFKALPSLYGWIYNLSNELRPEASFLRAINSVGTGKLKEAILRHKPDLVIHTFPQLALPDILKKSGQRLPLVNIVTDFDLHTRWIHSGVDRYYVATEDMKAEMVKKGVPESRVLVSGIPLRPDFQQDLQNSRPGLTGSLDREKKTVLLMAGAYGVMQGIREICEALLEGGQYRILAVCGRNEGLYNGLKSAFGDRPDLHLFGYVQEVALLMHASDCIITKPGGITLAESLASRLPMFLYRPVPGQELNNARYLKEKGVASIASDAKSLRKEIDDLLLDEQRLAGVRAEIENLRKPDAAEVIVGDILDQWFRPDTGTIPPVQIGSARPRLVIH
ncbi:glycosyltransferase [Paenibacillus sp. M1]|uniref:Glycosyltransferase n=1 Tax=Paenibacillus haidiansis TaxID=1574488 RepID=A0ABU7VR67_9BACL